MPGVGGAAGNHRGLSLTWLMRRADQVLDPLQVEVTWREAKLMTLGERPRGGDSW
jgi:hypothetical protein